MQKKYTINQLVVQVNQKIREEESPSTQKLDNRVSDEVSERKVRDMLSKNFISKGIKDGKSVYFDDIHVEQILEYKKLQSQGFNERVLKSYSSEYITDNKPVQKNAALEELDRIKNSQGLGVMPIGMESDFRFNASSNAQTKTVSGRLIESARSMSSSNTEMDLLSNTQKYRDLNKLSAKSYMEYPLDDSGSLILKVETGHKAKNLDEILQKIKQIIGE